MKRFICVLICILSLLGFSACAKKNAEIQEPANFYYVNKDLSYNTPSGVICAEIREAVMLQKNLDAFLHEYLKGPENSDLQTYIPSDVEIISCEQDGDTLNLTFSEGFAKLTGTRLSTAACALLMSVHDYVGVETISIRVNNGLLEDKEELVLTVSDIVLVDPVILEAP